MKIDIIACIWVCVYVGIPSWMIWQTRRKKGDLLALALSLGSYGINMLIPWLTENYTKSRLGLSFGNPTDVDIVIHVYVTLFTCMTLMFSTFAYISYFLKEGIALNNSQISIYIFCILVSLITLGWGMYDPPGFVSRAHYLREVAIPGIWPVTILAPISWCRIAMVVAGALTPLLYRATKNV